MGTNRCGQLVAGAALVVTVVGGGVAGAAPGDCTKQGCDPGQGPRTFLNELEGFPFGVAHGGGDGGISLDDVPNFPALTAPAKGGDPGPDGRERGSFMADLEGFPGVAAGSGDSGI